MKVCPLCGSRYSTRVDFCFHDGAILASSAAPAVTFDAALDPPEPDALSLPEPRASATPAPARARTPSPLAVIEVPSAPPEGATPDPATAPRSPLIAPPPPPRSGSSTSAPGAAATGSTSASDPSPSFEDPDDDEPTETRGFPVWAWGALVAVVLIVVGGSAFAVGGMSFIAAMVKLAGGEPAPQVVVEPLEFPDEPEPAVADPGENQDRPRLRLGVQGDDDTDSASTLEPETDAPDDDASGEAPIPGDGEEVGDVPTDAQELTAESSSPAGTAQAGGGERPAVEATASTQPASTLKPAPTPSASDAPSRQTPDTPAASAPTEPAAEPTASAKPAAEPSGAPDSPWGATTATASDASAQAVKVIITIQDALPGTIVAIDGEVQPGSPPISVNLLPGKHAFRITGPSGSAFTLSRDVQPGDDGTFRLTFPQVK